jgi:hypothetical protein
MNEEIQIKIIELMDKGATLESSLELSELVNSSDEALNFYESILVSESAIESFFGGEKNKELSNKINAYVDEQFNEVSKVASINFKPLIGFAIAASIATIAFTFFNSSAQLVEVELASYEKPNVSKVEDVEPIYITGNELIDGLWGPASKLANEIGLNRYQIMYAIYQGNKENFINNDINLPKQNERFFVDLSLLENLETNFVIDEVKRHIFCSC